MFGFDSFQIVKVSFRVLNAMIHSQAKFEPKAGLSFGSYNCERKNILFDVLKGSKCFLDD